MRRNEDKILVTTTTELRRQAEERLKAKTDLVDPTRQEAESQRLNHELEVHQIELEMQNAELRQARDEAESAYGKYSDLYDFAPVGYFTLDREGIISAANLTVASLLGIERSQLIGHRFNLYIPQEARTTFASFLVKVFSCRDKETFELDITKKGKLTLHLQVEAVASASAEECRIAVIDISARKQAEDALKSLNEELDSLVIERTRELSATITDLKAEIEKREKAEENVIRMNRLHAVLSETNQAIVRTKDQNTLFNDFCRIAVEDGNFKLASVGLVDAESGEFTIVASEGATGFLDYIVVTANEEPAELGPIGIAILEDAYYICNDYQEEPITRPLHERASVFGIRASASIALKQEGRVIGVLTLYADQKDFFDMQQVELLWQMGADISFALDNMVREARRLNAERALREETIGRLRAVDALREQEQMLIHQSRLAAMGEMIGNIAHQWRQPLNTLGLVVQQLPVYYEFGEFTKEYLDKKVERTMTLIQHMSKTIDDFWNYFRPDKEKVTFNVNETISRTVTLVEDSFKNQHISIEVLVKDNPAIHGYRNEFAQVLLNILNNARDALTKQAIVDPKVMISICSESDKAVVTISDNARGIPEEILNKIFDPYFTTKDPDKGTGIGLFMSRAIIEKNMGGSLTARNTVEGAEFRIEV